MSLIELEVLRTIQESLSAWPKLSVVPTELQHHVQQLGVTPDNLRRYGTQLCLALTCASGDSYAIAILEAEFGAAMHRSLARIRAHSDFRDETLQCLRERLFVGAAPKIKAYAARGPLSGWLRRAALNVCFNLKPSGHDKSELETTLGSSIPCDVEFSIAKQRLVAQVALDDAAARLSVAQRELLRLHAHGWCIDQLASLGGKHRSTVGRSLAAIRMQLAGEVIEKFHGHFEMSRTEARWALGQLCDDLDARALLSLPSCVGG